ncbi:hypothetical protein D3C78_735300 [compost metagenome]
MQRGQGGAQVVGDVGHQFAALLVLAGQGAPLFAQALLHLPEGRIQGGDFVLAGGAVRLVRGGGQWRCGGGAVDVEMRHRIGQLSQRPGDQGEGGEAGNQAQQGHHADRPQGGVQRRAGGAALGEAVVFFAEQYHVEIAGLLAVDLERRGAEHLAPLEAARVVAENRQRLVVQQALHGGQVDLLAAQMTFGRGIADHPALIVEQVHLDTRVDQHQLAEQHAQGLGFQAVGVHQLGVAGDVPGQVAGQALHHLQLMHGVGTHLHPHRGATAHQQQQGEHRRQALAEGQSHADSCAVANL